MRERTNNRARMQLLSGRFTTENLIFISAVLAAIILLRLQGVSTMVITGVAIFGLFMNWFIGLRNSRQLYEPIYEAQVPDIQESCDDGKRRWSEQSPLTPRETVVLNHIAYGYINKEIAYILGISEQTVKNHVSHIMEKLNVTDRTRAVVVSMQNNWITADDSKKVVSENARSGHLITLTR